MEILTQLPTACNNSPVGMEGGLAKGEGSLEVTNCTAIPWGTPSLGLEFFLTNFIVFPTKIWSFFFFFETVFLV